MFISEAIYKDILTENLHILYIMSWLSGASCNMKLVRVYSQGTCATMPLPTLPAAYYAPCNTIHTYHCHTDSAV